MTVLILALLVVNIVLTSVMLVSIVGTNKKTAQLVDNITTAMNLELTVPGMKKQRMLPLPIQRYIILQTP